VAPGQPRASGLAQKDRSAGVPTRSAFRKFALGCGWGQPRSIPSVFVQHESGQTIHLQSSDSRLTLGPATCLRFNAMKSLFAFALLFLAIASTHAASDADVTIIKAQKVVIEENVITIVAEAKTSITLIRDDYSPDYKGANWMGRPVARAQVKSDKAAFVIKKPNPGVEKAWQESLEAAKDLQEGREVGRIGYYAPDISIKGNLIVAVTGPGYLYARRK
jgi:hypothetical protein